MLDSDRIRVFGDHDDATLDQLERCVAAEDGARGVLCADGHLGYSQPIGGVVAYREHVSPAAVGYDIGCGNLAARTDLSLADVEADLPRIMDEVFARISFGVGRRDRTTHRWINWTAACTRCNGAKRDRSLLLFLLLRKGN